jgi:hypothetical protein
MAKCGCGRSASGECVGLHRLSQEEWALVEAQREQLKALSQLKEVPVEIAQ